MGRFIPRGIEPHQGRGKAAGAILLACGLLIAAAVGLFAQTADNVRTYYMTARSFYIPFSIPGNDPRMDVLLHVSTDEQNYRPVLGRTNDRRFFFTAPSDGCYYFVVQTRDQQGAVSPADLRKAPPDMRIRVCVDTRRPVIEELTATPADNNSLPKIRWKINEPNLKEIWADYRSTSGSEWVPLVDLPVKEQGEHTWKPHWSGELEVRMQALDKADQRSEVKMLRLRTADNVTHMRPPEEPAGHGKVMYVQSKTFNLRYQLDNESVGPSRVASVDIWKLHKDRGWQKCNEKGTPAGPATVTVDEAGRWGFRLIPRSGVGLKEPDPVRGDPPNIWVEVDDQKPHVKITNVTVTQEADGGYLTVYWKADDTFLRSMPITISLGFQQGGPWTPLAADLANTGSWRHRTDDLKLGDRYEFQLKVTAIDEAGNIGEDQWRDTVKVDLKIPRIKHIEVLPGGAAGSIGQESSRGSPSTPYFGGASGSGSPLTSTPNTQPPARQTGAPINGSGQQFNNPLNNPMK